MVYQLGKIKFEPINSPTSFSKSEGVNLVEKERLDGLPTIQKVGGKLKTISLTLSLHHSFTDVTLSIEELRTAMFITEPLTLINGAGATEGDFLIEDMDTTYEKTDYLGRAIIAEVRLLLKQYVSPDPAKTEDLAARKAGFANISVNPITVTPAAVFNSPESLVMKNIVSANAAGSTATTSIKKAGTIPALAKKHLAQAGRALATAKSAATEARAGVDGIASKISNAVALKNSLDVVISRINSMAVNFTEPNLPVIQQGALALETGLSGLMTSSAQLTNVIVLRK